MAAALADKGRREVVPRRPRPGLRRRGHRAAALPRAHHRRRGAAGRDADFGAVQALLTPHSPGLTTLVAPVEPGSGRGDPRQPRLARAAGAAGPFDYVIVDTPPAFADHVLSAFDLSDVVALIATLDIPALKNLKLTLETMDLLNYPRDRWRIVLNRADSKVGLAIGEVEKSLRAPISAQIPSSRDVPAVDQPRRADRPRRPPSPRQRGHQDVRGELRGERQPAAERRPGQTAARAERRGLLRRRSRA